MSTVCPPPPAPPPAAAAVVLPRLLRRVELPLLHRVQARVVLDDARLVVRQQHAAAGERVGRPQRRRRPPGRAGVSNVLDHVESGF